GDTASRTFPTTPDAFQPSFGGARDAFVAQLSPDAGRLVYATYLGGSGGDYGYGIALDGSGAAYVGGSTDSTNFPVLGALQSQLAGLDDAFVAKLAPGGSSLVFASYLGGSGADVALSVATDAAGHAYVAGQTQSANFPTAHPFQTANPTTTTYG